MPKKISGELKIGSFRVNASKFLIVLSILCVILGVVSGAVSANNVQGGEYIRLSESLDVYLKEIKATSAGSLNSFAEGFIKYGKLFVVIWFLAFVPPGIVFSFFLLFTKGMSLGFASALLVRQFGADGAGLACRLYMAQNVILIPAYCCSVYSSASFTLEVFGSRNKVKSKISEYTATLIAGLFLAAAASLAETYLIRALF